MKKMITAIRNSEYENIDEKPFYGKKEKELEGADNKFRPYFNKSLMAGADIPAGAVVTKEMIFAMRPKMYAKGLPSEKFEEVIGRKIKKNVKKYEPINLDILE